MISTPAVVIYSGGLDSSVILHCALKDHASVHALTFNYNQRHKKEIDKAIVYCEKNSVSQKTIDISFYSNLASTSALTNSTIDVPKMKDVIGDPQNSAYCPNRNMVMISIAAAYAESIGAEHVYYGAAAVDNLSGYFDCTVEFLSAINDVLSLNRRNRIEVKAPLIELSKKQIIELGLSLGAHLGETWTCYEGKELSCGICPSCSSRIAGFKKAGFIDPLKYSVDIDWKECNILM